MERTIVLISAAVIASAIPANAQVVPPRPQYTMKAPPMLTVLPGEQALVDLDQKVKIVDNAMTSYFQRDVQFEILADEDFQIALKSDVPVVWNITYGMGQNDSESTVNKRDQWVQMGQLKPGKASIFKRPGAYPFGGTYTLNLTLVGAQHGQVSLYLEAAPSKQLSAKAITLGQVMAVPPSALANADLEGERRRIADPAPKLAYPAIPVSVEGLSPDLTGFLAALHADGEHNAVLNFQKLGLAAMESGEFAVAEWAFDAALDRIEAIYAENPNAKSARSKWKSETIKDFKGEPHERAMAYYYRGLLYLRVGDYDNARATFKAAEYQDTVAEDDEYLGDFSIMEWLAGWAARCGGNAGAANESFRRASAIDPVFVAPPVADTTLVLAELGSAPVKRRGGQFGETLYMAEARDRGEKESVSFIAVIGQIRGTSSADIRFQALTRGGRPIDDILQEKAQFKGSMARTSRNAASAGGSSGSLLGLGVGVITSAVSGVAASETSPGADLRMWDQLPDKIVAATGTSGTKIRYEFSGVQGKKEVLPWLSSSAGACSIQWARSHSALSVDPGAPGDEQDMADRARKRNAESGIDAQLQDFLTTFPATTAS